MPLNIRSNAVNEKAERLAKLRSINKTEAVRQALDEALRKEEADKADFMERIRAIQDRFAARGRSGLEADKEFYDSLNDE